MNTPWIIERIDEARMFNYMGNRSLVVDSNGHPHIAYGEDFLYYAHHDGVTWHVETVDASQRVGWHTSLALDAAGRPHISYCRWICSPQGCFCDDLKYAHYDDTTWQIEIVDDEDYVGEDSSLALDTAGYPHISYCRWVCNSQECFCRDLKYARYDGSVWQIEGIGSGSNPSLALDAVGRPHVSYCQPLDQYPYTCHALRYTYHDGTSWFTETVDSSAGASPSIALDATGRPHIGYRGNGAMYAYYDGTSWFTETVDHAGISYPSLALDAANRPHISYAYAEYPNYELRYTLFDGSSWMTATVESRVGQLHGYAFTSLALSGEGFPSISYLDFDNGKLRHTRYDDTTWTTETVDKEGSAGLYPSYYDASNADLKYTHHDGAVWITEIVDSAGDIGEYTSLRLDRRGYPHISYHDATDDDLKYGYYDGTSWNIETVDSTGTVGWFTSLALDADGRPHISYCSHNSSHCDELMYAWHNGNAWITETVANGGSFTSLALDSRGQPHIAFHGGIFSDLVYAYLDGGAWQTEILYGGGSWGDAGLWASLELDPANRPHISYGFRYNHPYGPYGRLYYIYYDGSTWQKEQVDGGSAGLHVGYYSTLALDSWGRPHIGYQDSTGGDLKYAHPACSAVHEVDINGPPSLLTGQPGIYQANPQPITASNPITFTWDNGAVGTTAIYSGSVTGIYTLTVTGTNECGQGWGSFVIRVLQEWPHSFYLPLMISIPPLDKTPPACYNMSTTR